MLVVDLSASFYSGRTFSDYQEQLPRQASYLTDIHTDIKDRNQAYAVEADYVRHWQNSRFTAGLSYTANRNRSEYVNLAAAVFHQRQDKVYFFAEYFYRFNKWSATVGMGAQYTDFLFKDHCLILILDILMNRNFFAIIFETFKYNGCFSCKCRCVQSKF